MSKRAESIGLVGTIGALIAYGCWRVAEWTHFLTSSAYAHRSDFAEYYLTASIGERFGWKSLYSRPARDAVARTFPGPPVKNFPIDFPPTVGWMARPFTYLSLDAGYWLWLTGLTVACVITWWLVTEGSLLKRLVLLAAPLTLFPVVFGFTLGQVVGLELLGVAVAYACLSRRRDFWAGLALSPLVLHPQCLLLVPLILIPLQRWRAVVGFVGSVGLQALLTVAVLGPTGVRAFLHEVNYVQAHRIEIWSTLSFPLAVHNPVVAGLATVSVVAVVMMVARRNRGDIRTAFAAAMMGSLLVAPFIHIQDEMSLLVAAWFLVKSPRRLGTFWLPVAAFGLLAIDTPSMTHSWGYFVMGMEAVWLVTLLLQRPGPRPSAGRHFAGSRASESDPDLEILEVAITHRPEQRVVV